MIKMIITVWSFSDTRGHGPRGQMSDLKKAANRVERQSVNLF